MKTLLSLIFLIITTSSFAVTFDGKFIQGSFILGKTKAGSEVFIDKKKIKVTSDGYFAFGLGRDRKNDVVITINEKKILKKVFKREYNIQKIDGLEEKKVTPPEEVYERIKRENKWISKARNTNSNLTFFTIFFSFIVITTSFFLSRPNPNAKYPSDVTFTFFLSIKTSEPGSVFPSIKEP